MVSSANQRSTRLSQDALVGVKWSTKRGWAASQRRIARVARAGGAGERRQDRGAAIEGLVWLLIDAQNQRPLGRVEVEAD